MAQQLDLCIRNARLRKQEDGLVDIGIAGGKITRVEGSIVNSAMQTLDAEGALVTEPFANPHLHLCKVYTLPMMDEEALGYYHGEGMGRAMNAVEVAAKVKEHYDRSWIIENGRRALALAALHGMLYVRAFADVDNLAGQEGLAAVLVLREEFKDLLQVQVVAFAEDGILREPGAADLIRESMRMGADVVGGHPFIELTDEDAHQHVRVLFDIAEDFDADISMLVDDAGDPGLRQTEMMAVEAIRRGWTGRVLAHHARAMSSYPVPYYRRLAALLKKADMGVVTNPHTGPLFTRVRELLADGIDVTLGQDDISDAYYPYGRNNMLEVAFLASHLLWMTTAQEMETLYDMATIIPTRRMRIEHPGIIPGAPADLVVLAARSVLEALRWHEAPKHVVSRGQVVDTAKMRQLAGLDESFI
jgi:cytosine/creatinine deaminase